MQMTRLPRPTRNSSGLLNDQCTARSLPSTDTSRWLAPCTVLEADPNDRHAGNCR